MRFCLIILYRLNKWHIGGFAGAEGVALYWGAVVVAVADAGAECEGFFFGGE